MKNDTEQDPTMLEVNDVPDVNAGNGNTVYTEEAVGAGEIHEPEQGLPSQEGVPVSIDFKYGCNYKLSGADIKIKLEIYRLTDIEKDIWGTVFDDVEESLTSLYNIDKDHNAKVVEVDKGVIHIVLSDNRVVKEYYSKPVDKTFHNILEARALGIPKFVDRINEILALGMPAMKFQ